MDAIQFLKIVGRICKANDGKCDECPLDKYPCSAYINRIRDAEPDSGIEEMVNIADRWAKDHPFNTRQDACWVAETILNGDTVKRVVVPCAKITEIEDIVYKDDEALGYGVTISATPDSAGNTHYEYLKKGSA